MEKLEYSIPIYENDVKTEWTVNGIIGDEKYLDLIKSGDGKTLPMIINVNTSQHCVCYDNEKQKTTQATNEILVN